MASPILYTGIYDNQSFQSDECFRDVELEESSLPVDRSGFNVDHLKHIHEDSWRTGKRYRLQYPWRSRARRRIGTIDRSFMKSRDVGIEIERPKIAISKSTLKWFYSILIHVIPITAALVIVAINLGGWFIGTQFVGVTGSRSQSIALLSLQITSKWLEILFGVSLGFIVLEMVHYFLFKSDSGLPLGLAGVYFTFTSLFYLMSRSFWNGIGALETARTSCFCIGMLIISCGFLANLIGPSTAVLLIPTMDNQWPAGGLRFRLTYDIADLWPPQMTFSRIGGANCSNPSEEVLNSPDVSYSGCIWYAATMMGRAINDDSPWNGNYTVDDDQGDNQQYWRYISWFTYQAENSSPVQWNWSIMSIANVITAGLFVDWAMAANGSKALNMSKIGENDASWSPLSRYARYSYRDPFGSQSQLSGMYGPIARTSCTSHLREFNSSKPLHYPKIPAFGDYVYDTNATYEISTNLVPQTTDVRTLWIDKRVGLKNKTGMEDGPSALLAIQIPLDSTNKGIVYACSVDARWANVTSSFDYFNDEQMPSYSFPATFGNLADTSIDPDGRPLRSQISDPIDLDIAWLNQLTPALNGTGIANNAANGSEGYNSFSNTLNAVPRDVNQTSVEDFTYDTRITIEGFLPMLVVDGLARHNLNNLCDGSMGDISSQWLADTSNSDPRILLSGGGGTETLPAESASSTGTELLWTVTISGYAYSASNTGSILALITVFAYVSLALSFILYKLTKRESSQSWSSIPEMLAVCHDSPSSGILHNIGAGIKSKSTLQLRLKLRAAVTHDVENEDDTKARDRIHVLIKKHRRDLSYRKSIGYQKIEKEKKYS